MDLLVLFSPMESIMKEITKKIRLMVLEFFTVQMVIFMMVSGKKNEANGKGKYYHKNGDLR